MTAVQLLQVQIEATSSQHSCPHNDDCIICRERRLAAQVAQEILNRIQDYKGEDDNNMLVDWAREFTRQRKLQPNNN